MSKQYHHSQKASQELESPPKLQFVGIDPGPMNTAYTIIDSSCEIQESAKMPNGEFRAVIKRLNESKITYLCLIEAIDNQGARFAKMRMEYILDTAEFIGFLSSMIEFPLLKVSRRDIYRFLLGKASGKDSLIREQLLLRYGKDKTKGISADQWSSLAIATFGQDQKPWISSFRQAEGKAIFFQNSPSSSSS